MIHFFRLCIYFCILVLFSACSDAETSVPSSPTAAPTAFEATKPATITAPITRTPSPLPNRPERTVTPEFSKTTIYHDPDLGIALQYPSEWKPIKIGRMEGPNGFFELTYYDSIASHIDFFSGGLDYRLTRACDWEVNVDQHRYGDLPFVRREFNSTICVIKPGAMAEIPFPTAILYAPSGGFAILRTDLSHFEAIVASLSFDWPGGFWPWPDFPQASGKAPEQPVLETRSIGQLTADIYRLHKKAEENLNADYMELQTIMGPVLGKNEARRMTWETMERAERVSWLSQQLARLGYTAQLEEDNSVNLYQNGEVIYRNLFFSEPALATVDGQVVDYGLIIETPHGFQLARKGGTIPWDFANVKRWRKPVFLGKDLLSVEINRTDPTNRIMLKKEDEVIYTYISSMPEGAEGEIDGLYAWDGRWVMLINGTLIVDGEIMNERLGYGEIFGWQLLDHKPFYFFEKNGKIGINYDGQEQNFGFTHLFHDPICPSCMVGSVQGNHELVWFWAWEDGAFYYIEVGK